MSTPKEVMVGTRRTLSEAEARRFEELDANIRSGMAEFLVVGRCLLAVRDEELWEQDYDSFKAYAKDRHDIGKAYASRLIASSGVVRLLEDDLPNRQVPVTESQVRPRPPAQCPGP